jgi:hypothetical protein
MRSRRCSTAGRPRRRACRWSASPSRSCGTRSASRSTMRSIARHRSVKKPDQALGERDRDRAGRRHGAGSCQCQRRRAEDQRRHGRARRRAARASPGGSVKWPGWRLRKDEKLNRKLAQSQHRRIRACYRIRRHARLAGGHRDWLGWWIRGAKAVPADAGVPAAAPAEPPRPAPKRVIAMRGDDRPGMKKAEPAAAGRGGKFGDRKDSPRGPGRPGDNKFEPRRDDRGPGDPARASAGAGRRAGWPIRQPAALRRPGPASGRYRISRAARGAGTCRGRACASWLPRRMARRSPTCLAAWQHRKADRGAQPTGAGRAVSAAVRGCLDPGHRRRAQGTMRAEALLRLEMAAELPTPAEHLNARRALAAQIADASQRPGARADLGPGCRRRAGQSVRRNGQARRVQNVLEGVAEGVIRSRCRAPERPRTGLEVCRPESIGP